ncbi:MAG: GNAT family N-acetyltransferase [Rubrobacteraceae bacterium]
MKDTGTTFRPATREDSRRIAELFRIASGGVADYVWSLLEPEYPGLTRIEIGEQRYARQNTDFSYENCAVAERAGAVIGMTHGYRMGEPEPEDDDEAPDPVLEPYTNLEAPGSFYISSMAVLPQHRGGGLGTRMLEISSARARELGLSELSLIAFEQNEGAVRLYERNGFQVVDRVAVVPHAFIRYTGDALLMVSEV